LPIFHLIFSIYSNVFSENFPHLTLKKNGTKKKIKMPRNRNEYNEEKKDSTVKESRQFLSTGNSVQITNIMNKDTREENKCQDTLF
jgi:hypothetical protein